MLPLFKKSECNVRGASEFHGAGGPLTVPDNPAANLLSRTFVEAGSQIQLPVNGDFNGENQLGVGLYQTTTQKGRRGSTAATFFAQVNDRPNLTTLTGTQVQCIMFDGKRADGVEIATGGDAETITATREVLLCGGAINSPLIDQDYLSTERDMEMMLEALRLSRQILGAPAFDAYRKKEIEPVADVSSRDDIIKFIRNKTESVYHPVGTCKMGAEADEMAVVGPDLKVRGVTGLRVVDASVMPRLVGGNTNAPAIMIAEKAAVMILDGA